MTAWTSADRIGARRKMPRLSRILALVLTLLCAAPAQVQAQLGMPPEVSAYAAGVLAQWIEDSRAQAIQRGVQPVPPAIYRALLGYFPASLLNEVRYRSGTAPADHLPFLAFRYGDALALTLDDVIVFRDRAAEGDLKLWAHELTHVMQYRRWGVGGFAARYLADPGGVEREAYANADRFIAWHHRMAH
jgi:hypothetical protein